MGSWYCNSLIDTSISCSTRLWLLIQKDYHPYTLANSGRNGTNPFKIKISLVDMQVIAKYQLMPKYEVNHIFKIIDFVIGKIWGTYFLPTYNAIFTNFSHLTLQLTLFILRWIIVHCVLLIRDFVSYFIPCLHGSFVLCNKL